MSTLHKFLAFFLVLSLLFSIAGCNQTPAEPTVPPVTASPEMIASYMARCSFMVFAERLRSSMEIRR